MTVATGEGHLRTHLACQACQAPLPDASDEARGAGSLQFCATCASAIALEAGIRIDEALDSMDGGPALEAAAGPRPAELPAAAGPLRSTALEAADPTRSTMLAAADPQRSTALDGAKIVADPGSTIRLDAAQLSTSKTLQKTRAQAGEAALDAGGEEDANPRLNYRILNNEGREIIVDRLEIIRRIREGKLLGDERIWPEGADGWQQASDLTDLSSYFDLAAGESSTGAKSLLRLFQYPLLGWGPLIWIGCGLLVWIAGLSGFVVAPLLALPLVAYSVCVVRSSAEGHIGLPGLPDRHDWREFIERTGLCAAVVATAGLPLALALYVTLNVIPLGSIAVPMFFLILELTAVYLPMGILVASTDGTFRTALDPRRVLGAILVIPKDYGRTLLLCTGLSAMAALCATPLGLVPGVGGVGRAVIVTYFALIQLHALGRMGRRCESVLRTHLSS